MVNNKISVSVSYEDPFQPGNFIQLNNVANFKKEIQGEQFLRFISIGDSSVQPNYSQGIKGEFKCEKNGYLDKDLEKVREDAFNKEICKILLEIQETIQDQNGNLRAYEYIGAFFFTHETLQNYDGTFSISFFARERKEII